MNASHHLEESRFTRRLALAMGLTLACLVVQGSGCNADVGDPAGNEDEDAAPPPDAPPTPIPDAAPLPDANLALFCDQVYGQAPGYIACDATETTCSFNANTAGGNCQDMCQLFGGTCIGAIDNPGDPGTECTAIPGSMDDCLTLRATEICICNRLDPSTLPASASAIQAR